MATIVEKIDRVCYPNFGSNWDDSLFRDRILSQVNATSTILDLGAGAGIVSQMNFRGLVGRVCGVDLDPRVLNNPMLDESRVSDAGEIPWGNEAFDLVFSDNVLEHLSDPLSAFKEVARVLKPGGIFAFKTPNKWHYMPTVARLTPHVFHQFVNRLRGREHVDTFPTRYRANTVAAISTLASKSNFAIHSLERVEGRPEYLRVAWPLYAVGVGYERFVNSTSLLAPFRILLIGILRKEL